MEGIPDQNGIMIDERDRRQSRRLLTLEEDYEFGINT